MEASSSAPITPEQLAAVQEGGGFALVEDLETHRVYLLIEQGQAPTLDDDYFREKLAEGIAESERGESKPWDVCALKDDLRRRHTAKLCNRNDG